MNMRYSASLFFVSLLLAGHTALAGAHAVGNGAKVETEKEVATEDENHTYAITAPTARNLFSAKVLDKMRKELMRQAGLDVGENNGGKTSKGE